MERFSEAEKKNQKKEDFHNQNPKISKKQSQRGSGVSRGTPQIIRRRDSGSRNSRAENRGYMTHRDKKGTLLKRRFSRKGKETPGGIIRHKDFDIAIRVNPSNSKSSFKDKRLQSAGRESGEGRRGAGGRGLKDLAVEEVGDGQEFEKKSPNIRSSFEVSRSRSHSNTFTKEDVDDDMGGEGATIGEGSSKEVQELLKILKIQRESIQNYKLQLKTKRRKLENFNNYSAVTAKEQELKILREELRKVKEEELELISETSGSTNTNRQADHSAPLITSSEAQNEELRLQFIKEREKFKTLQAESRELDKTISKTQKLLLSMARKLSQLAAENDELTKVMNRIDWAYYSEEDAERLRARLAELKRQKEELFERREAERKTQQKELEGLVERNRKLDEELRLKEKQIRFNTLQLRSIKKGYAKKSHIVNI